MMGHTVSVYHDVQMKGIECLRNIYAASGLSIRPRTKMSRIEMLKEICRAWVLEPDNVLTKEALSMPHRICVSEIDREQEQVQALSQSLKEILKKELLATKEVI